MSKYHLVIIVQGDDEVSVYGIRNYDKGDDTVDSWGDGMTGVAGKSAGYEDTWM